MPAMTPERTHLAGLALALVASILLGTAVAVSRYAYDAGASGIAVAGFRTFTMTLVFAFVLRISGQGWAMPRELVPLAILNGTLMAGMAYGVVGSVEFISVGLASLLFFTFPVIIAVIVMAVGIERVSPFRICLLALAFTGLAIMLGASISGVDLRGVACALVAAMATALNAVLVARCFQRVSVMVLTFHFSLVALVVLALAAVFVADVRLPDTASGWGGLLGVAAFQVVATPMYLYAMMRSGALQVGMVANVQPVTSIVEAWVLFDEVLGLLQALGGALVLIAIAVMQWSDHRERRRAVAAPPVAFGGEIPVPPGGPSEASEASPHARP